MTVSSRVGEVIRRLRESCGCSRADLARDAGLSLHWLRLVEQGAEPRPPEWAEDALAVLVGPPPWSGVLGSGR